MPRAGVDTDKVVAVAAELIDEIGVESTTLKEVSERLGIRSPSLYNHIGGLPELKEKVSRFAMGLLRDSLVRATIVTLFSRVDDRSISPMMSAHRGIINIVLKNGKMKLCAF